MLLRHLRIHVALTLTARGGLKASESDVCRRQILTSKVDPRIKRITIFIIALDP